MAMALTLTLMELSMKATGKKISKMGLVKKHGLMGLVTKVITNKEGNQDMESLNGQMAQSMKGSSWKTIYTERVNKSITKRNVYLE